MDNSDIFQNARMVQIPSDRVMTEGMVWSKSAKNIFVCSMGMQTVSDFLIRLKVSVFHGLYIYITYMRLFNIL